jgi:hypothetical protein
MKPEQIIIDSLDFCISQGIKISKNGMFDWTIKVQNSIPIPSLTPTACDASGAVLWSYNQSKDFCRSENWLKETCRILDVDTWWHYRFCMGFDRNYQILSINEKDVATKDEVSMLGIKIAKEYLK